MPKTLVLGLIAALTLTLPLAANGRQEGAIQAQFDAPASVKTLVIHTDRQDVVITRGGPKVSGRLIGTDDDQAKTRLSGSTYTVTVKTERAWYAQAPRRSARVEITVPDGLEIEVSTASGNIDLQVETRRFQARTGSGNIDAVGGGQALELDTASGSVTAEGYRGPAKVASLSGNLNLRRLEGAIRASVLSGNLEGSDLKPADQSRFSAVSGNIDLSLVGGASQYVVKASAVSGNVQVSGGSSGPRIDAQAVSGNVRIR